MTFPFKSRTLAEVSSPDSLTGHALTIYEAIRHAAVAVTPCPTNQVLGELCDLTGRQASDIVRKMAREGYLELHVHAGRRKIVITATGETTGLNGSVKQDASFYIKNAEVVEAQRLQGCDGHHTAILRMYARMAKERDVGIETAMLHAQHGRKMVEQLGR